MKNATPYKELETGLVIVLTLVLLYLRYALHALLIVAIVLCAVILLIPAARRTIHWGWMKIADTLGYLSSRILLTLVFVVVVIPLGWITRLLGKTSVQLKNFSSSSFKSRNHLFDKDDLVNPW